MNARVLAVLAVAACSCAFGQSSVSLNFNGSQGGVANTGFGGVYNQNNAGFSLGANGLSIDTLPGDTFGQYGGPNDAGGADPDTAQNFFYSPLDAGAGAQIDAKVMYSNLVSGYAGGGIWTGMDTDHYIREGVYVNGGGQVAVEVLRENQDLWSNNEQNYENPGSFAGMGGPGRDIVSTQTLIPSVTGTTPFTIYLRLIRNGNDATAYYSMDGSTYTPLASDTGDPAGANAFDAVATDTSNLGVPGYPGSSVELPAVYKVGAYAINGPVGTAGQSVDTFESFSAVTLPEPAAIGVFALAWPLLRRRK